MDFRFGLLIIILCALVSAPALGDDANCRVGDLSRQSGDLCQMQCALEAQSTGDAELKGGPGCASTHAILERNLAGRTLDFVTGCIPALGAGVADLARASLGIEQYQKFLKSCKGNADCGALARELEEFKDVPRDQSLDQKVADRNANALKIQSDHNASVTRAQCLSELERITRSLSSELGAADGDADQLKVLGVRYQKLKTFDARCPEKVNLPEPKAEAPKPDLRAVYGKALSSVRSKGQDLAEKVAEFMKERHIALQCYDAATAAQIQCHAAAYVGVSLYLGVGAPGAATALKALDKLVKRKLTPLLEKPGTPAVTAEPKSLSTAATPDAAAPGASSSSVIVDANPGRAERAAKIIGRKLTPEEELALGEAHLIGQGQPGKDGQLARVEYYTDDQIKAKLRRLNEQKTFTPAERKALIRSGEAGLPQIQINSPVSVPRTDGSVTNGFVIRTFKEDGRDWIRVRMPDGAEKEVRIDRATEPLNVRGGVLRQGDTVGLHLGNNYFVRANVESIANGHAHVRFRDRNAQGVEVEQVADVPVSWLTDAPTAPRAPNVKLSPLDPSAATNDAARNFRVAYQNRSFTGDDRYAVVNLGNSTNLVSVEGVLPDGRLRVADYRGVTHDIAVKDLPNVESGGHHATQRATIDAYRPVVDALKRRPTQSAAEDEFRGRWRSGKFNPNDDSSIVAASTGDGHEVWRVTGVNDDGTLRLVDKTGRARQASPELIARMRTGDATDVAYFLQKEKVPERLAELAQRGIEPKHEVRDRNATYKFSDFFTDGDGRLFTVAEVTVDGQTSHRVFYRSNSAAEFRQLPARNRGLNYVPGYDKAAGEDSLALPGRAQEFLAKQVSSGQQSAATAPKIKPEELDGLIYVNRNDRDYAAYAKNPSYIALRAKPSRRDLFSPPGSRVRTLKSVSKVEFRSPETLNLTPGANPDFSHLTQRYPVNAPSGPTTARVYVSRDGTLEYTFLTDTEGKSWVSSVRPAKARITPQGVPSEYIEAHELTVPRWEYRDQIPTERIGRRLEPDSNYWDAWGYVRDLPVMRDFYREGLRQPLPH